MAEKPNVVYLLTCLNEKYKGRVYIGYTVDPSRRLTQHNRGKEFGGANKTNNKGPWDMVLFVSGFPNEISALRFEWTWQHPGQSRRLTNLRRKKRSESNVDFHLYLLEIMLGIGPWNRLPLCVHWLNERFAKELPSLPDHVRILYGHELPTISEQFLYEEECLFCAQTVDEKSRTLCTNFDCSMTSHLICLAKYIISDTEHVVPIRKHCPLCDENLLWGDIIKSRMKNSNET